jgi:phytanoyl-CoA hydroxylase
MAKLNTLSPCPHDTMNDHLSEQQVQDYQNNGFVAHRNLLSKNEVAELKAAVLEAVSDIGEDKVAGGGAKLEEDPESFYAKVFTQKLNLWRINEKVRKFMLSSEIGVMLSKLSKGEKFRVWHDQALIKEPYGNPTAWHLDNPYWSFHSKSSVSIWIALEPATFQNGCMSFMPGSQNMVNTTNSEISPDLQGLVNLYPELRTIDPVGVPMEPGDCSFHNGLTAHGAGANMTRDRRIAMACAYMPVGSTFNGQQNVLPDEYVQSLKVGDTLCNDDWNPLV